MLTVLVMKNTSNLYNHRKKPVIKTKKNIVIIRKTKLINGKLNYSFLNMFC